MLIGTFVSLALGILLRLLIPGHEVTTQVTIRGVANILDLLIAFFAGVAAGYAMARPKLSGALPGVAIAVALVPPLTAAGIAFGCKAWPIGFGALLLYTTNMVAIVLGSALVFRVHGIKTPAVRQSSAVTMMIDVGMGSDIDVKINVLRQGEVGSLPPELQGDQGEDTVPVINE